MGIPKLGLSDDKRPMHYVSAAIIEKNGKYLMIDRKLPPFGFAAISGHVDFGEDELHALIREVKEETGLKVTRHKLVFEGIAKTTCVMGITRHYFYLFVCKGTGKIRKYPMEEKSIAWYSPEEIKKLKLEPVWKFLFKKLKII